MFEKIFILEDSPDRMANFRNYIDNYIIIHTDNVREAKILFEKEKPFHTIFLDHDLDNKTFVDSNEDNTGYQFVKFLTGYKKDLENTQIILHSMNGMALEKMYNYLQDYQIRSILLPWPLLLKALHTKGEIVEYNYNYHPYIM